MKKIKYLIALIIIGLLIPTLTGCSKSIEHKKDISIKDIINDKKEHLLYMVSNKDGEPKVEGFYLTKNGQIKMIGLDLDSAVPLDFAHKLDVDDVKKMLDSKHKSYEETPYHDVNSYLEVTTENGKPIMTLVTTKKISEKKAKEDFNSALDSVDPGKDSYFFYTNVSTGQSQGPTKDGEYTSQFAIDPSAIPGSSADDSDYKYMMIKLDNKDQKIVDLSPKDKDVTQIKFSDFKTN